GPIVVNPHRADVFDGVVNRQVLCPDDKYKRITIWRYQRRGKSYAAGIGMIVCLFESGNGIQYRADPILEFVLQPDPDLQVVYHLGYNEVKFQCDVLVKGKI